MVVCGCGVSQIVGEGVYACFNEGSCIGPDTCDCADGWTGYDCNTREFKVVCWLAREKFTVEVRIAALCRHQNYFGETVGCLNLGICGNRDDCTCMQVPWLLCGLNMMGTAYRMLRLQDESNLYRVFPDEKPGTTGWMGSDCSIGTHTRYARVSLANLSVGMVWYSHLCSGLVRSGLHHGSTNSNWGCLRGRRLLPLCERWELHQPRSVHLHRRVDRLRLPNTYANFFRVSVRSCCIRLYQHVTALPLCAAVCTATATFDIVEDLVTVDPQKIQDFELDPCGENNKEMHNGAFVGRGNCSAPNTCTCLCRFRSWLDEDNQFVGPRVLGLQSGLTNVER